MGKAGKEGAKAKGKRRAPAAAPAWPQLTEEQRDVLRRKREALKKQAAVEAHLASKKYVKRLKEKLLQPSRKHYGGQGYAKDSVFVDLSDPEYAAKFRNIWDEHIPGFSGKSFKKRKSEADDEMLWRQRVKEKASGKRPTDVDHLIASLTKPTKRSQSQAAPEAPQRARGKRSRIAPPAPAEPVLSKAAKRRRNAEPVGGDAASLQAAAVTAYRKLKASKSMPMSKAST